MFWYPVNHVLHTYQCLTKTGSDTVYCGAPEVVKGLCSHTIIEIHEVKAVSYGYGSFEIDLEFSKKRHAETNLQRRELQLCDACQKDLMWSRIQNLENAFKNIGQAF